MASLINRLIGNSFKGSFRPDSYKPLSDEIYQMFKSKGEGLYYSCIKSEDNNFVSRAIPHITELYNKPGKEDIHLSHCVAIFYSENLKSHFTPNEWDIITKSWNNFYGNSYPLDDSIKVLVMASADDNGMNYFNFSQYQSRDFSLRKVELPESRKSKVLRFLVSIAPLYYDYTGLVFWWLYRLCSWFKFLDDSESLYCSENMYEAFKCANFKIADNDEPSPLDIENYNLNLRFYTTPNFLNK